MDDDLLAAAAEALGVPPEVAMRSAQARADAGGTTVEAILQAWAGPSTAGPPSEADDAGAEETAAVEEPEETAAVEEPEEPTAVEEPEEPTEVEEPEEAPVEVDVDEELVEVPQVEAPAPAPAPDTVSVERAADFEVVTTVPTASIKERTRAPIPAWLGSLFVALPLLAVLLLVNSQSPDCGQAGSLEVDPVTGEIVNCDGTPYTGSGAGGDGAPDYLVIGREIYTGQGACFNCHGTQGEGLGVFPPLTGVLTTFSACSGHIAWVFQGSTGWSSSVGPTYGDTDKPVQGGMPGFGATLTQEQIQSVAVFERVEFGGGDLDEALVDCELVEPAEELGQDTTTEEGTEG